jgi:hypothetical protein
VLASGQVIASYYPFTIAADGTNVYWGTFGIDATGDDSGPGVTGNVMRAPVDGGSPAVLAPAPGTESVTGIAVDSTNVYWGNDRAGSTLWRTPLDGGQTRAVFPGRVQSIAVDATDVYWTSRVEGTVTKAPKVPAVGDSTTTLVSGVQHPFGMALDDTSVYYTDCQAGLVMKVSKTGGAPLTLASDQHNCTGLTVDSTDVYFTTLDGVMKVPIGGGAVTVFAPGQSGPGIAVDATNVYWTIGMIPDSQYGSGLVMRAPKR